MDSDTQEVNIQHSLETRSRRRRRPRVADENRQRATRACDSCRVVKEKCHGGTPCKRCMRLRRDCIYTTPNKVAIHDRSIASHDESRLRSMELIIMHFLGDIPLSSANLQRIAEKLQDRGELSPQEQPENLAIDEESFTVKTLSNSTAHYSGEFSHWNFSQRIRRRIDEQSSHENGDISRRLQTDFMKDMINREYWRASQLHLTASNTQDALQSLPPRRIADFLTQIFFRYAQTNHSFAEESWVQEKVCQCYGPSFVPSVNDAAWICSVLMVLAVGTQFAHLEEHASSHAPRSVNRSSQKIEAPPEDGIGITFYHAACKLIPDLLIVASVESAQAFLLLAAYSLPLDAQGLGYTYLGLSIKMCVQNGMHRKQSSPNPCSESLDLRRRLWWSAYSLDRRISILHGRPATVAHSDVDADCPTDLAAFHISTNPNKDHNLIAIINLTGQLGEIAYVINLLRRCPKTLQNGYIGKLLALRDKMHCWWQGVSGNIPCKESSFSRQFSRPNIHLKMSFHLNQIYMGRPFLFHHSRVMTPESPTQQDRQSPCWSVLAIDCVDGALAIIDLCRLLQEHTGLARASYTEFSSCRAALLAIIAQSLNEHTERLESSLTEGLKMIREMMVGNDSAMAEVSVIEALANATRRLMTKRHVTPSYEIGDTSLDYNSFKSWAASSHMTCGDKGGAIFHHGLPGMVNDTGAVEDCNDMFAGMTDVDLNELLASFPLEQGGFGLSLHF